MSASLFAPPRLDRSQEWESRKLRSLLRPRSERNRADLPLLSVARERGVFVRSAEDANHNTIPEDLSNYKVARRGDLVINKMKSWQGSLGLAPVDGIVSPAYFVFEAGIAVPQFGHHLLRSKPYVAKFGAASDGVRVGQWDLNVPRMREIELMLPEAEEQAAIVKYLAHANARIDKAIAAKRRLTALCTEEQQAVAREWLTPGARIQGTWKTVVTKRLCRITTGVEDSGNALDEGGYPFFVRGREVLRASDYSFDAEAVMTPGDGQGGVGKVFHYFNGKFQAHQRVYVFLNFQGVDARYFYWSLCAFFRAFALSQSNTVTMESLRMPVLAYFPVSFPPIDQQGEIVGGIERETARIQQQIEVAEAEINLLREFRTRLVADVVTGQVDVRGMAASLPEVDPAAAWSSGESDSESADRAVSEDRLTESEA